MNDRAEARAITLTIAAVERDTGLSKDTLRVWERRYGFPVPGRDPGGERSYPLDQVEKLRIIKRLMDAGHRPGRIVARSVEDLQALADQGQATAPRPHEAPGAGELRRFLELIRGHDAEQLRAQLLHAQARLGLGGFVHELVSPLNGLIGEAWMRGHLEVFQEHLYTECLQTVLRQGLAALPAPAPESGTPRVLLTTVPHEVHGLGLLMAEAVFRLEGCRTVGLGVQTPIPDIVRAAAAHRCDVVALSFTAILSPNAVVEALGELREALPGTVELWAGGAAPVLQRRPLPGVRALDSLGGIVPELRRWRTAGA